MSHVVAVVHNIVQALLDIMCMTYLIYNKLFMLYLSSADFLKIFWGPPGVLGIWGEWLFIFRELGSTGNYFRGSREQAHNFGDVGSPAKKQKK